MLKFGVKVFNRSYFPDHVMDLVYILYDDRYRSKAIFSNIPIYAYDLKVKLTDVSRSDMILNHLVIKWTGTCLGELCCMVTALVLR